MPTVFCENINRKIPAEPGENLLQALQRERVEVYRWPLGYLQSRAGTVLFLSILLAVLYPLLPGQGLRLLTGTVLGVAIAIRALFSRAFDFSYVRVISGQNNLSDRGGRERKALGNKPESYRLASQCYVNGDVTLATQPSEKIEEEYW